MDSSNKEYSAQISIGAKVDSSLVQSIGLSTQELMKFQRAVNDIAKTSAKVNMATNGLVPKGFEQATQKIGRAHV